MNSYILIFRKKIIFSFVLILCSLITVDIGLYFYKNIKTTKTTFINEKFSKIQHFNLNSNEAKDIIFIGSSKTFYQISTNVFKKNNFNIYNFGISGINFEDFPALIPSINNLKPKEVIISMSVNEFYNKLPLSRYPSLNEIEYYYGIDKIKFLKALKQLIVNSHLFLQYSENIFYRVKSIYEIFDVKKKFNKQANDLNRLVTNDLNILGTEILNNKTFIDEPIYYSKLVNCEVFDIRRIDEYQTTLKCTNGDGVLVGVRIKNNNKITKELTKLNQQSVKYLQKLISNIDKEKIKVLIILEPSLNNTFIYDINDVKKEFIGIKFIDLTSLKIQDKFWLDNFHLNYKGREHYSQYLSDLLKFQ